MKLLNALIAAAMAAALCACDNRTVYSRYLPTDTDGWERTDTIKLAIDSIGHGGTFEEWLGMRINGTYPFKGITIIVEHNVRPGGRTTRQTLNIDLFDKNGNPIGDGISSYQYAVPLETIELDKGDTVDIFMRHNMMRETLPGVTDVGITLKKAD